MTVDEDVCRLISSLPPEALCDDCIMEMLAISLQQYVSHQTRALFESNRFPRGEGRCAQCGMKKVVTRRTEDS